MVDVLVIFVDDPQSVEEVLESGEYQIRQQYGRQVAILGVAPETIATLQQHRCVVGVFEDAVPEAGSPHLDETGQMGIAAWNARHDINFRDAKHRRPGDGLSWDELNGEGAP